MARHLRSNRRGRGHGRDSAGLAMAHISRPRGTLAAWEQVAALLGPVCAEPGQTELSGRLWLLRKEARAAGPGWGQARQRAGGPDPCTFGGEHATASIGQRLPGLDAATPSVEPMEKARQE